MRIKLLCLSIVLSFSYFIRAQVGFPVNGVAKTKSILFINNANIYTPEGIIENGKMVIAEGIILSIGKKVKKPTGAIEVNLEGKYIYPSFIAIKNHDAYKKDAPSPKKYAPQITTSKKGPYHWNESVQPENKALDHFEFSETVNKKLRASGIGTIHSNQKIGVMSGNSFVYCPTDESEQSAIIKDNVGFHLSFKKGKSRQTYPSSQMGIIALIKQSFIDADWYKKAVPNETNLSLQAINENENQIHFFETSDKLEVLRAAKIMNEFNRNFIIYSGGDDYQRMEAIKASNSKIAIPLKFPDAYNVKDPYDAEWIPLKDLKHWELAPANAYFLHNEEIDFVFNLEGLTDWKSIHKNIQKVYQKGLSEKILIDALTSKISNWIGIDDKVGTLSNGKLANFIVLEKPLLENDNELLENWVLGKKFEIKKKNDVDIRGKYTLNVDAKIYELEIKGTEENPQGMVSYVFQKKDSISGNFSSDTAKTKVDISLNKNDITLSAKFKEQDGKRSFQLHGFMNLQISIIEGNGKNSEGQWVTWNAIRKALPKDKKKKDNLLKIDTLSKSLIWYPNVAYGFDTLPEQQTYFFENVTLWTNEEEGVIKNGSLLIQDGKIKKVNEGSAPSNAIKIDGKDLHLTNGIIDEHSHIAISKGVNESGKSSTAEVSIQDVIRPNDVNIYRQLAGGVTTSQLLHGSANAIGGQSALIKLRWGSDPDEMLFKGAPGFIKFALGENVKQANWGDFNKVRFPQTRMGVEQVYYDAFYRALAYEKKKKEKQKDGVFRKDLELETLVEILNNERFITCHSYIQSEINMLMHVADSMNFKVNTFTHILEGYKIADKMATHGAGASTFSDWWAYKFEVNDAIPYNAALMHKEGIVVALNSDDAEMGRRLNQEAAKAVKYGGVTEQEAWKMITLNPAKLLHIDQYVGSLKEGKDADLVLWSYHPLTAKAKPLKTFVDGKLMFDRDRHEENLILIQKERARIIQLMMDDDSSNKKTPEKKKEKHYHCDTIIEIE